MGLLFAMISWTIGTLKQVDGNQKLIMFKTKLIKKTWTPNTIIKTGWSSKIERILNQIKVDLPRIRHEAAHSIGHDQETSQYIFARFANQKPYVQISVDGETASLPPTLPLDELTVKKAKELIDLASQPDTVLGWVNREKAIEITSTTQVEKILGYDPSKGLPVYLRNGSFGEYVSLGDFPKWPPMSSKEGAWWNNHINLKSHQSCLRISSSSSKSRWW